MPEDRFSSFHNFSITVPLFSHGFARVTIGGAQGRAPGGSIDFCQGSSRGLFIPGVMPYSPFWQRPKKAIFAASLGAK